MPHDHAKGQKAVAGLGLAIKEYLRTPRCLFETGITTPYSCILRSRAGMDSLIANGTSLIKVSQTLRLFHHRNKNQHRRSKWWKWFALLRRSVNRLLTDLQKPDETRASVQSGFLTDILRPRCYKLVCLDISHITLTSCRSFSHVVGDRQFAALGLVLLGVLSELDILLRTPPVSQDLKALVKTEAAESPFVRSGTLPWEDTGQRIERPIENPRLEEEGGSATKTSRNIGLASVSLISSGKYHGLGWTAASKTRFSKKASKSHNAIDELFSGIG